MLVGSALAGAWEDPDLPRLDAGVTLGVAAVRSSTGNHRVDPAYGLWVRRGFQAVYGEVELMGATDADATPGGSLRRTLVRPSVVVGWRGGSRPMHVGMAGGVAMSLVAGNSAFVVQPGVRACGDLHIPLGEKQVLVTRAGVTTRGRGADVDASIGWGFRW